MKINSKFRKTPKPLLISFIALMVVVGVYFVYKSFASAPPPINASTLPSRADETIIEISHGHPQMQSVGRLPQPITLPFRLYGSGLAVCGDYSASDTAHPAQYYYKQMTRAQVVSFVSKLNKQNFASLSQQYVSAPSKAVDIKADTITLNSTKSSTQVTVFRGDSAIPAGYTYAHHVIDQFCAGLTQPYISNNVDVQSKVLKPEVGSLNATEGLPSGVDLPNTSENVHVQANDAGGSTKALAQKTLNQKGVAYYQSIKGIVQTVATINLPVAKYKTPTNPTSAQPLSMRLRNLFVKNAQADNFGTIRFAIFCPRNGAGCALPDIEFYKNTVRDWYHNVTGKDVDMVNIGVIYGVQDANYYINYDINRSSETESYTKIFNELDSRNLLIPGSPLEIVSGFNLGFRDWCGVGRQPEAGRFNTKTLGLNDPSTPPDGPTGGVCSSPIDNYQYNTSAHELGHNLTLAHTTGMGQAGGIMGYDYHCNWPACSLASFQVPIVQAHPLFYLGWQRLDVVVRGSGNQIYHKWYSGGWSSGYEPLGGNLISGPAVASRGPGLLDIFGVGTDHNIWHKWYDARGWHGWEKLDAPPYGAWSDPAAIAFSNDSIQLFVRGIDNNVWHKYYQHGVGWSRWDNLGGNIVGGPAAAGSGPNDIHVFARNGAGNLIHRWWNGAGWSSAIWENLGGVLTSDPAAVSMAPGRYDVFARGKSPDYHLWHTWYDGHWNTWESLGGKLTSSPGVASWFPGRLDVFVRGADGTNQMYHKWYNVGPGWSGWESLGGVLTSDPDAVSWWR